jgi:SAM-dependent methyltransferase
MARLRFAAELVQRYAAGQDKACPYCASTNGEIIGRKYFLLQAIRCSDCGLIFRYPKPDIKASESYYQSDYDGGIVTTLPSPDVLRARLSEEFRGPGPGNDYSPRIEMLKRLGGGPRLFEFGCSWGYGLWQFRKAGFDAAGFEVSRPRAQYGRRELDLQIASEKSDSVCAAGTYDVVFSTHVLEHIPDLATTLDFLAGLLKPQGLLMIFCPNGGGTLAKTQGLKWGPFLSEDHVNSLTADFLVSALKTRGLGDFRCATEPFELPIPQWQATSDEHLAGGELLVLARRD